jgi:FkbM family methyltransferase
MPSFIYGIEIVKLFKQQQEKIVFFILLIGIITNGIVTSILLYNENEITNILLGSAVIQLLVLVFFENINSLKGKIKIIKQKHFYSKFNLKNKLCFDIGANIGYKSSIFASLNAKVIAFEPQSNCIPFLEKIKTKYPNFIYEKIAIGDLEKSTELHIGNHIEIATLSKSFIDFYQTKENNWNTKEIVNVSTLNKMIELYGIPYYCKIDTEGYEWQILNSLSYSIPLIEFEFTEGFFDDTLKIIALFDENLVTFNYILNENTTFKLKNWANKKEIILQLKLLPKNRLHGNLFIKRNDILNPNFKVK